MSSDRKHYPLTCPDCDGWGCGYCDDRGYFELCGACRKPIGNRRRKWKRRHPDEYAAEQATLRSPYLKGPA